MWRGPLRIEWPTLGSQQLACSDIYTTVNSYNKLYLYWVIFFQGCNPEDRGRNEGELRFAGYCSDISFIINIILPNLGCGFFSWGRLAATLVAQRQTLEAEKLYRQAPTAIFLAAKWFWFVSGDARYFRHAGEHPCEYPGVSERFGKCCWADFRRSDVALRGILSRCGWLHYIMIVIKIW